MSYRYAHITIPLMLIFILTMLGIVVFWGVPLSVAIKTLVVVAIAGLLWGLAGK
ncbi:MAG: hypothetical protein ACFE0Q_20875 [Anaerolineae bacterium]